MVNRNVRISLDPTGEHVLCDPKLTIANVEDTLLFVPEPPDLPFHILFGDPFSANPLHDIEASSPRTLTTEGRFFFKCFATRADGRQVGWFFGENPESGGDVDVRP
ncbi:MAG: hypothetical protein ACXW4P_19330 [Thermoanaerobaculia bacterium]